MSDTDARPEDMFSDEALFGGDSEGAVGEPSEAVDVAEAAPSEPSEAAEVEAPTEPVAEEPVAHVPGETAAERALRFKSHEEAERGYSELQSHTSRKLTEKDQELAATRAELQQYQEYLASLEQQEADEPVDLGLPFEPQTSEDLAELVSQSPEDAVEWAAHRAPEYVSNVIAAIAQEHGEAEAMRIQTRYMEWRQEQRLAELAAQHEAQLEERMSPYEQRRQERELRETTGSIVEQVRTELGAEVYEALKDAAGVIMQQRAEAYKAQDARAFAELIGSPLGMRTFTQSCFEAAYRQAGSVQAPAPAAGFVESGTPGVEAPVTAPEDDIANAILTAYQKDRTY